ncbi:hypothetical protein [Mycoplasmopsis cricetuli]|uniref:hypothetical protein n=1 Tax=Mycoplasmopsis cricetuli TaxID=171283 RepID=UPI00046FD6DF|nr:hypothetical protein [Mycoplasmopsis cricetuli]
MSLFSLTSKVKDTRQWIYIVLWILFCILLVTVVLLISLYTLEDMPAKTAEQAYTQWVYKATLRSNLIASIVVIFVAVFFAAIISTVVINGFVIKKNKDTLNKIPLRKGEK